ncbi:MAG: MarR family winged helix-turn-helix transcriptional regulator [Actinomycetes bacterium]
MTTTSESPGRVETEQLAAALRPTLFRLYQLVRRETPTLDLTMSQGGVVATLATRGPLRMGALAAAEDVRLPSITESVAKLEALGLVSRMPDPADGRAVLVDVTDEGRRFYERVVSARTTFLVQLLDALDASERARLSSALPVLDRLLTIARDEDPASRTTAPAPTTASTPTPGDLQ